MQVAWEHLCQGGQAVQGLDDVTRLDLSPFCRKMEPCQEAYYRCCTRLVLTLLSKSCHAYIQLQSSLKGHITRVPSEQEQCKQ